MLSYNPPFLDESPHNSTCTRAVLTTCSCGSDALVLEFSCAPFPPRFCISGLRSPTPRGYLPSLRAENTCASRRHLTKTIASNMAPKSASKTRSDVPKSPGKNANGLVNPSKGKPTDYSSHGVTNNDLFMLPSSDFQLLGLLTGIAAVVRLFRIYQPTSVVFDEVQ